MILFALIMVDVSSILSPDLSGTYDYRTSSGIFVGKVIIRKSKEVYTVQYMVWKVDESDDMVESIRGIGVQDGLSLAVGWAVSDPEGIVQGVVLYRVWTDESGILTLLGRWASLPGNGRSRREELRRVEKGRKVGK